jgi:hypothetical protein
MSRELSKDTKFDNLRSQFGTSNWGGNRYATLVGMYEKELQAYINQ